MTAQKVQGDNKRKLFHCGAIVDADQVAARPGAILVDGFQIVAAGTPQQVGDVTDAARIDLDDQLVLPALVNSHAHLDLTHIGPIDYTGDFVSWVDVVRARRAVNDADIAASVRLGIERSRAGGTAIIGDIAGVRSLIPINVMREERMPGISFLEIFGVGERQAAAIEFMCAAVQREAQDDRNVRLGLQPHAPYSCGPDVFRAAAKTGLPLATHLAETLQELEFVESATGPLADMLQRLGVWDDTIKGHQLHPVDFVSEAIGDAPIIAAHLNYLDDRHLQFVAESNISVAYCPRASAYFGHPLNDEPPHRYRDMLSAGINVALGTDSQLCLDTADRISVLDDMRFLYRRDGTNPRDLLTMATRNGARALRYDEHLCSLRLGPVGGLISVPFDDTDSRSPLVQAMHRNDSPRWILGPFPNLAGLQSVHDGDSGPTLQ